MSPMSPLAQVRVARPTRSLAAQRRFYAEVLGLQVVAEFSGHAGYSGVVFGLPGLPVHLEFTEHAQGGAPPAPDPDDLLVLYLPGKRDRAAVLERLSAAGSGPRPPANPYWARDAHTFTDPDGWQVVIAARPLPVGTSGPGPDQAE